jgi:hypothetical protein
MDKMLIFSKQKTHRNTRSCSRLNLSVQKSEPVFVGLLKQQCEMIQSLFENSVGSVRRVFSVPGASPILADATSIDCGRLLPGPRKSLVGPLPRSFQTVSQASVMDTPVRKPRLRLQG